MGGAPAAHAVLEVFCFESNPLQPEVIVGGRYNGQIIMWDTASQEVNSLLLCA